MIVAVTYENENIFPHFGKSEQFKIYSIENDKVIHSEVVGTRGQGHGALAVLLSQYHVDTLICGGIGAGAVQALAANHIRVYPGVEGNTDQRVDEMLKGELVFNAMGVATCDHHHDHGEGCHDHDCGEHDCSSNSGCCGH